MAYEGPLTIGQPVTISGYVIDKDTLASIPGVIVTNGYDSVTTDDNGYFLLTYDYAENKSTLTFIAIGFESYKEDISKQTSSVLEFIHPFKLQSNTTLSVVNIVANKTNKFFINGFVVDENGKGIQRAIVKLEWFKKIPISIPSPSSLIPPLTPPPIPLNSTAITDNNGVFEFSSTSGWDLEKSSVTFSFPNYYEKVLSLADAYSTFIAPTGNTLYPLGRISLSPKSAPIVSDDEIITEIKRSAAATTPDDPGFVMRLLVATIKLFNAALDRLIPYLRTMLIAFAVKEALALAAKACPAPDKLNNIINSRNKIVSQINNLYNGLRILTQLTTTTTTLTTSLTAALNLYYIAPISATLLTAGTISFLDNQRQTIKEDIDRSNSAMKSAGLVISYCLAILTYILQLVNILDQAILFCSKKQQVEFASLNSEITNAINASENENIIKNNTTYKGFKLELKLDTTNNTAYPKRYAQALNAQNIPVLKTDSSFASDPQVLIDQLKFIIDSNPNLTAE